MVTTVSDPTVRVRELAARVEAKDPFSDAHPERVAESAVRVGARMGLPVDDIEALYLGGCVHDIGKISVPREILLKPGALDDDERITMELHPVIGANIANFLDCGEAVNVIRHHHERYDGAGYPDGLTGEGIPILARIVAVCDAYDAMTNDRPYRSRTSPGHAAEALRAGAGSQWDPQVVRVFLEMTA